MWRGGPPGRRTNWPTWQVPGSPTAQSAYNRISLKMFLTIATLATLNRTSKYQSPGYAYGCNLLSTYSLFNSVNEQISSPRKCTIRTRHEFGLRAAIWTELQFSRMRECRYHNVVVLNVSNIGVSNGVGKACSARWPIAEGAGPDKLCGEERGRGLLESLHTGALQPCSATG